MKIQGKNKGFIFFILHIYRVEDCGWLGIHYIQTSLSVPYSPTIYKC